MALILTDEQECELAVEFKTAAGNAGRVDGIPSWSVSNPGVVTIVVSDDGLEALVKTTGALGESQVSVSADADLGAGVRAVSAVLDVTVQSAEVVTAGIVAGAPRVKTV
jgi:hypothetical protein